MNVNEATDEFYKILYTVAGKTRPTFEQCKKNKKTWNVMK